MPFNSKTFKFSFDEIKSNCGYDNLKFSRLLLDYIVNDLKVEKNEINESLDLMESIDGYTLWKDRKLAKTISTIVKIFDEHKSLYVMTFNDNGELSINSRKVDDGITVTTNQNN